MSLHKCGFWLRGQDWVYHLRTTPSRYHSQSYKIWSWRDCNGNYGKNRLHLTECSGVFSTFELWPSRGHPDTFSKLWLFGELPSSPFRQTFYFQSTRNNQNTENFLSSSLHWEGFSSRQELGTWRWPELFLVIDLAWVQSARVRLMNIENDVTQDLGHVTIQPVRRVTVQLAKKTPLKWWLWWWVWKAAKSDWLSALWLVSVLTKR